MLGSTVTEMARGVFWGDMSELAQIDGVEKIREGLKDLPQVDLNTQHAFMGGMYARTIYIPAGCAVSGATHKTDHINVMFGDIAFTGLDGQVKRLTGFHVIPVKAGIARLGVALVDTVWTTICKTDKDDVESAEDDLVVESAQLQTRLTAIANKQSHEKIGA